MPQAQSLQFKTALQYEKAGLRFNIALSIPEGQGTGQTGAVSIFAENLATGARVPFTNAACPALADFMAGYPRWLVRLGIQATAEGDECTGTARAGATIEELADAAAQMADMIDQKFSLYKDSVLV